VNDVLEVTLSVEDH